MSPSYPSSPPKTTPQRTLSLSCILVIHNHEGFAYKLEASVCSIGRDQSNAIVLNKSSVSRQHALLMRVPVDQGGYSYRLVDGNSKGQPSKNGIYVNGRQCSSQQLQNGDMITFGPDVRATYLIMPSAQVNSDRCLDALQICSIKEEALDAKATTVAASIEDITALL